MSKLLVVFSRCVQNIQVLSRANPSDNRMVSRVFFSVYADDGRAPLEMYVEVHQPHGTDFLTEPLEVATPRKTTDDQPCAGLLMLDDLSSRVEWYYRRSFQGGPFAMAFMPGAESMMINNVSSGEYRVFVEAGESSTAW